jgi:hypothetical protein
MTNNYEEEEEGGGGGVKVGCIPILTGMAVLAAGAIWGVSAIIDAGDKPKTTTQTPSALQQTWTDVNNPELIEKTKGAQMFWGVATGGTLLLLMGGLAALDTIKKR